MGRDDRRRTRRAGGGRHRDESANERWRPIAEHDDDDDGETEWVDRLVDERPNQEFLLAEADEMAQRRKLLGEALTRLNEREREIVIERRLRDEPLTLEDLRRRFHVSRERIRQLEVRAIDKLRKAMLNAAKTLGLPADLAAA
jgi:RNA polymerase sigma-32 factor